MASAAKDDERELSPVAIGALVAFVGCVLAGVVAGVAATMAADFARTFVVVLVMGAWIAVLVGLVAAVTIPAAHQRLRRRHQRRSGRTDS